MTNYVFFAQFFNTGFLILLVNANLSEHEPKHLTQYLSKGQFYDYQPDWYLKVGKLIVQTMLISSLMPYVGFLMVVYIPKVLRMMDNKDPFKTKMKSIQELRSIWFGADFIIHIKQSENLNILFVSMMYGVGMPILFPLAAFNFMNQWICDRYLVAWHMRLPPSLDDTLMRNFIGKVRIAPIIMAFNGYWMIENKQIFDNVWFYVEDK